MIQGTPPVVEPFTHLLKTHDMRVLWMLRILAQGIDIDPVLNPHHYPHLLRLVKTKAGLGSDTIKGKIAASAEFNGRLAATIERLETRTESLCLPKVLRENLEFLREQFSFNQAECLVLALAVSLRIDDALFEAARNTPKTVNMPDSIARILGISAFTVARALASGSRLRRANLIEATSGGNLAASLCLRRGGLRILGLKKIKSVDEILDGILEKSSAPSLLPTDYPHLKPDLPSLQRYLADALGHKRTGVNILLHGAPGTGKSELVRVLAKQLQVPLFNVADADENCEALAPEDRLSGAATGLFLLGGRRAIMCFDEVEAIFNHGSAFFGKPSLAESRKSFFNRILEQNQVPMFWIANSIRGIDPAFARRFDMIIHLESPPQRQRLALLERECVELVPRDQLKRLARIEHITPAMVTKAARVVRRTRLDDVTKSEKLLETLLDGVLQAQRRSPLSMSLRKIDAGDFIPSLCNADIDLEQLAEGLSRNMTGRFCLYGPPGTGKTAFGHWLAEQLDRPLVLKRVSDLQSPYLGEMEQNLAMAFATAKRDGAILQIDEVDSFLQDRRRAKLPWEISQINEFLTQLEGFDGLFIASTNLMDDLDQAALRRFDFKIQMDYLRPDQALAMLEHHLEAWGITNTGSATDRLRTRSLTPGDFAVVARRHQIAPFVSLESVLEAICEEAAFREPLRSIGFIGK